MLRKEAFLNGSSNILGINLDGERLLVVYGSPTGIIYERLSAPVPAQVSFSAVLELIMVQADRLLTLTQAQHLPVPDRVSAAIPAIWTPRRHFVSAVDFPLWSRNLLLAACPALQSSVVSEQKPTRARWLNTTTARPEYSQSRFH
jgi:hypothetical protein